MNGTVIVWDLETVPDLRGFAAANDLVGKTDHEIREVLGNKFPKHIYHSIACIGALVAHRESDHWQVDALGAPHVGERTEKQLISAFVDKIAELSPQLVTFNGNSFDLPVLRYRAMINEVSAPGLSSRPYFNRYTEDALDLCDVLSSFAPHTKASLNELSRIMGMPGKPDGIDGAEVERYFLEGKIKEIAEYCETRHRQYVSRVAAVRAVSGAALTDPVSIQRAEARRVHQGACEHEEAFDWDDRGEFVMTDVASEFSSSRSVAHYFQGAPTRPRTRAIARTRYHSSSAIIRSSAPAGRHPDKDCVAVLVLHSDAIARLGNAIADLGDLSKTAVMSEASISATGSQQPLVSITSKR